MLPPAASVGPGAGSRSSWPVRAAYVYLAVPAVMFLAGWLRWWWLIPALAAVGFGLWRLWVEAPKVWVPALNRRTVVVAVTIVLILGVGVVLSGIGGISYQHGDHAWRNTIFEMLVEEPWPVVVDSPVGGVPLTYYFGFWLPAALVGKAAGIGAGWAALLAWTGLGLAVFSLLALCLLKRFAVWPIVVFAIFGGMDLVEKLIWGTQDVFKAIGSVEFIDPLHLYAFTSFGDQLTTVFNQALPAWILTALVLAQRDNRSVIAVCALGAVECPLPEVGLAVVVAVWMVWRPGRDWGAAAGLWARIRAAALEALTPQNLLVGGVGLVVFGSFLASTLNQSGFAFRPPQNWTDVARLAVFWVFEFGVMFALVARPWRGGPLWWAAFGTMFALPLMTVGAWNDLNMRAVIPAQVVLFLMVCWTLAQAGRPWRSLRAAALVVVLVLGSGSTLHTVYFHGRTDIRVIGTILDGEDWHLARQSVMHRLRVNWRDDPTAHEPYWRQYFGDRESLFYRVFARVPAQTGR